MIPRSKMSGMSTTIQELWAPIFPATFTARLRYSDVANLTTTSGVVASYIFCANGLYDPNISFTGHQPMGFDQMMLSYEHYTVKASRIMATFKNTTASNPTVAIAISPAPTPLSVIAQIIEFGGIQSTTLENKGVDGCIQLLNLACNVGKFQGGRSIVDNPSLEGSAAANPVEGVYFILYMWDAAGFTGSCNIDVVIEYDAVFKEPRQLTESLRRGIHELVSASVEGKKAPVPCIPFPKLR